MSISPQRHRSVVDMFIAKEWLFRKLRPTRSRQCNVLARLSPYVKCFCLVGLKDGFKFSLNNKMSFSFLRFELNFDSCLNLERTRLFFSNKTSLSFWNKKHDKKINCLPAKKSLHCLEVWHHSVYSKKTSWAIFQLINRAICCVNTP